MNASLKYDPRAVQPLANKATYGPGESNDFETRLEPGSSYGRGSFRITGTIDVRRGGNPITVNDEIYFNPYAGWHSLFRQFITRLSDFNGSNESLERYGGMVAMRNQARVSQDAYYGEIDKPLEGFVGSERASNWVLAQGEQSFSLTPFIICNRSNMDIPSTLCPTIEIHWQLAPAQEVLYGPGMDNTVTYTIRNLELYFDAVPTMGDVKKEALFFNKTTHKSYTIDSNLVDIQFDIPGLSNSVSSTFIIQTDESDVTKDYLAAQKLPGVRNVRFSYNGSDSAQFSFPIKSQEEILVNYQKSLGGMEGNSLLLQNIQRNVLEGEARNWGIGVAFGQLRDLDKIRFQLSIESGVSNLVPYTAHLYFNSVTNLLD